MFERDDTDHPHKPSCPPQLRSYYEFSGTFGDTLRKCQACGRFREVPPHPSAPPSNDAHVLRYVCRIHDLPCNWRGKGCKACLREQRDRARANNEERSTA